MTLPTALYPELVVGEVSEGVVTVELILLGSEIFEIQLESIPK